MVLVEILWILFFTFTLHYFISFQAQAFKRFLPMFDRVLVERFLPELKTKGGIMLPEKSQGKVLEATVVAVGSGARKDVSISMFICIFDQFQIDTVPSLLNCVSLYSIVYKNNYQLKVKGKFFNVC